MCAALVVWVIFALVVGGAISLISPLFGGILFIVIVIMGAIQVNSAETRIRSRDDEIAKAKWIAEDAGAIKSTGSHRLRIVDDKRYDALAPEVRMTLEQYCGFD
ncbi:MAG: hypothetical protein F4X02_02215 [Chloroflexi bacterium]|nr:hypothetical protein [Chloroflexota bacterium]